MMNFKTRPISFADLRNNLNGVFGISLYENGEAMLDPFVILDDSNLSHDNIIVYQSGKFDFFDDFDITGDFDPTDWIAGPHIQELILFDRKWEFNCFLDVQDFIDDLIEVEDMDTDEILELGGKVILFGKGD